jgi:hypothetical protein
VGCRRRNGEGRGSWVFALLVVGCRRRNGLSPTIGCGLLPTKWGRVVGYGLSPIVLVGVGLGGREREVRMGKFGMERKGRDGGEMREK